MGSNGCRMTATLQVPYLQPVSMIQTHQEDSVRDIFRNGMVKTCSGTLPISLV